MLPEKLTKGLWYNDGSSPHPTQVNDSGGIDNHDQIKFYSLYTVEFLMFILFITVSLPNSYYNYIIIIITNRKNLPPSSTSMCLIISAVNAHEIVK